ncbi:MAG: hypothetical protein CMI23_12770 [Opitutae bacterium]|jgi:hypothetical protein|nr:hypothetical protein [Opitutae bacterium]|tara:strand:- start:2187 stop:3557 length:1371 start_codon:yes stop_codon:yes gene_type:complete
MSENENLTPTGQQSSSDFGIEYATLSSTRTNLKVDVSSVLVEVLMYEHIDKPFVTGSVTLINNDRVLTNFDIQGAEIFEFSFKRHTGVSNNLTAIAKKFIVQRIDKAVKTNEFTEVMTLRLIDCEAFYSGLQNVTKCYDGQPQEIITNILDSYLKRPSIQSSAEEQVQDSMKVIVPNMTPLAACQWIKNRSTTKDGYPFFFYKAAITDRYFFVDLKTMLETDVINDTMPFTDMQASGGSLTKARQLVIRNMDQDSRDDMYAMIDKGTIGSRQKYYDITKGDFKVVDFNIHNDIMENLKDLNKRQYKSLVDAGQEYNEIPVSSYRSREFSYVSQGKSYNNKKGYDEALTEGEHRRKIKSYAYKHLMQKVVMNIQVDADEFIQGDDDYTVGKNIKVLIRAKSEDENQTKIDIKKSGDYLIMAANYNLAISQSNRATVNLLITKIADYVSDDFSPIGTS